MMYGVGFRMGLWMIVGWVIVAAVIAFALYGLIIMLKRSDSSAFPSTKQDPLEIIKHRLAIGEITREEYNVLKEELKKE